MRGILDKTDTEKGQRRNNLILGIFLIFIMLSGTIGYAFFSSDRTDKEEEGETITYNGLDFTETGYDSWRFKLDNYNFETKYNPEETTDISVITTKTLQNYGNRVLYFGIESEEDISLAGNQEILRNLNQFILRSNFACLSESCEADYPIKDCSDENIIVFQIQDGGFTRIRDEDGCVYIYSSDSDVEKAADAFLFKMLNIQ